MTRTITFSQIQLGDVRARRIERVAQMDPHYKRPPVAVTDIDDLKFRLYGRIYWNAPNAAGWSDFMDRFFRVEGNVSRPDNREIKSRHKLAAEIIAAVVEFDLSHTPLSMSVKPDSLLSIQTEAAHVADRHYRLFAEQYLATLPAYADIVLPATQAIEWIDSQ